MHDNTSNNSSDISSELAIHDVRLGAAQWGSEPAQSIRGWRMDET